MAKKGVILSPDTANKLREMIRGRRDGGGESYAFSPADVRNNRVALVRAHTLRVLPSSSGSGTLPSKSIWTADVVLFDALQNIVSIGAAYLYDPEDGIVAGKVYVAVETAPDELDGTPIFVTSTATEQVNHSSGSPGNTGSTGSGSGIEIVTDVTCNGGLEVTSKTLTATVVINGMAYPVIFQAAGGSGSA